MCKESKSFSKYLVIFVDILGSRNRTDFNELYKINEIFHNELMKNQEKDMQHTIYFRKIYTFSDCSYIFYGFKEGISDERKDLGKLFTVALCNCEPIFLRLLKEKIIFRGGITYGDAYIDPNKSMFFGSAVNNAYKLESEIAIHPRIVVDEFVANESIKNISSVKDLMNAEFKEYIQFIEPGFMQKIPCTGDGIIEEDIDGQFIFNYLHFPENNIISQNSYTSCQEFLQELITFCNEQIGKNKQYKIIDKYCYLLRFTYAKLNNLLKTEQLKAENIL